MKDRIFYFADFNLEALLSLSEQLRGRKCTCNVTKMPKCSSLNWVIFVTFDDGVEWVFRCPMAGRNNVYSDETSSKIVNSEASTLMYLKAHTSIPVPEVYSYSGTTDNSIGVPYILQSKATGRSLGSYDWSQCPNRFTGSRNPLTFLPISDKGREKVMEQFGSIMAELSDHRFPEIDSYRMASRRWNDFVAIGQKIDHSKNRLLYCIAGQFLVEMIPQLSSGYDNSFTLSHPDLHVGNIYVDDDLNITCIIDWSSASTGPIAELLATPGLGGLSQTAFRVPHCCFSNGL
ncbi:uncharacterized protein TrAtP1_007021 [Trichoderma atroviride]|uniref:uncharacterized protein n=1 Tax=Hypocrea atroviridis TaxID=63577 RepID=UPI00331F737F|nr:hypothetical protein TrAtP1_007021 [Trichoderma atroviride]